ncbi:MAG: hypothetical protein JW822_14150 [Spirochaetales bacterium]|nr:hypothetical protein [Spirochaetales bacterium]
MKIIKPVLLLGFLLSIINCIPFSNPLTTSEDSVSDNRLLGLWQGVQENADDFFKTDKSDNLFSKDALVLKRIMIR